MNASVSESELTIVAVVTRPLTMSQKTHPSLSNELMAMAGSNNRLAKRSTRDASLLLEGAQTDGVLHRSAYWELVMAAAIGE